MDYLDLELNLTEDDLAVKRAAQKFAEKIMRPIARELDTMTAEQVIAKGSPLWDFLRRPSSRDTIAPECRWRSAGRALPHSSLILSKRSWAGAASGLDVLLGVIGMPFGLIQAKARLTGETDLVDQWVLNLSVSVKTAVCGVAGPLPRWNMGLI